MSQNPEFSVLQQSASIPQSDSVIFYVAFTPLEMGTRTTKLFIYHDAFSSPDSLIAKGVGIAPVFSSNKTSIDFGNVGIGVLKFDTIYIKNTGTYELNVDSIYSTDDQFTFYPNNLNISVGDSQGIYVAFQPTRLGISSGKIVFIHDGISVIDSIQVSGNGVTDIKDEKGMPEKFKLYQNYPNPFNPTTTIQFDIPKTLFVTLKVNNVLGQEVATLVNENKNPGRYEINFDASSLPSGVYFYRITAGEYVSEKKLLLIR